MQSLPFDDSTHGADVHNVNSQETYAFRVQPCGKSYTTSLGDHDSESRMSYEADRKRQPPRMRFILDEGGDGEAVCQCGCHFAWSYAEKQNIVFNSDGDVRVMCPRCHTIE